jgi:hypothetical protein
MSNKQIYIDQYQKLKELNNGKKPLLKEFLEFCKIHSRILAKYFGSDAYSKLQEECGDTPNKLVLERTPISQILDQYGQLIKKHKRTPFTSDWIGEGFYPSPDGIRTVHKLKWGDIRTKFIEEHSDKVEWKEEIEILIGTKKN